MTDDARDGDDDDGVDDEIELSVLEKEAKKRKQRLWEMRAKLTGVSIADEVVDESQKNEQPNRRAVFRSYAPMSGDVGDVRAPDPKQLFVADDELSEHLTSANDTDVIERVDLTTLAPRKVDWDLKRDVSKRMEKLERRTQRAIAQLIRERLASGKQDILLSAAVNTSVQRDVTTVVDQFD